MNTLGILFFVCVGGTIGAIMAKAKTFEARLNRGFIITKGQVRLMRASNVIWKIFLVIAALLSVGAVLALTGALLHYGWNIIP